MTAKEPSWDRRKEDEELRKQTLKTLGAVQESIRLFERAINEHKADTENKFDELSEKVEDHSRILNGNSDRDGISQQLREMRRDINKLLTGCLGEGGNYDKSLKGQVEAMNKSQVLVQADQLKVKMALEGLEQKRTTRLTVRGQNLIVVAAVCGMLGAVTAASINAFKDPVKAVVSQTWERLTKGKPPPIPKHVPVKRKKARKKVPRPPVPPLAEEAPSPDPEIDLSKPQPAPMSPY